MSFIESGGYRTMLRLIILLAVSVVMFGRGYAIEAPSGHTDDSFIQCPGGEAVAAPEMDDSLGADQSRWKYGCQEPGRSPGQHQLQW